MATKIVKCYKNFLSFTNSAYRNCEHFSLFLSRRASPLPTQRGTQESHFSNQCEMQRQNREPGGVFIVTLPIEFNYDLNYAPLLFLDVGGLSFHPGSNRLTSTTRGYNK